jgi:hypothetical protein
LVDITCIECPYIWFYLYLIAAGGIVWVALSEPRIAEKATIAE